MELLRRMMPALIGYAIVVAGLLAARGLVVPVVVAGGSMRPALAPGDLAIVARHSAVKPGDVALITPEGHGPVLHRVVAVAADGRIQTRGDANPTPDARPSSPSEVEGPVVSVVPVGAWIERWRGSGNRATLSTQSNTARR